MSDETKRLIVEKSDEEKAKEVRAWDKLMVSEIKRNQERHEKALRKAHQVIKEKNALREHDAPYIIETDMLDENDIRLDILISICSEYREYAAKAQDGVWGPRSLLDANGEFLDTFCCGLPTLDLSGAQRQALDSRWIEQRARKANAHYVLSVWCDDAANHLDDDEPKSLLESKYLILTLQSYDGFFLAALQTIKFNPTRFEPIHIRDSEGLKETEIYLPSDMVNLTDWR